MNYETVTLKIVKNAGIPQEIHSLSPEEQTLVLKVGYDSLMKGRKTMIELSHQEIHNKLKEEMDLENKKRDMKIEIQRETIEKIYEKKKEQTEKQLEIAMEKIKEYELANKDVIEEETKRETDKLRNYYEKILEEKERKNQEKEKTYQSIKEVMDKMNENIMMLKYKTSVGKGSEGEKQVSDYLEDTFRDFKGFELLDKHTQAGAGDFHMLFEEFDVLVDAKNYKTNIPSKQREKIKTDLLKNEHLPFAWMISLHTPIDKWDKAPVMYEWINTKQCIVYINHLTDFEDPKKLLRIAWFTCRELYKMIEEVNEEDEEITEWKEKSFKLMDTIRNARKRIREINTSMNATRSMIQLMDEDLRIMMELETQNIVDSHFSLFDDWWSQTIEYVDGDSILLSTDVWYKFKQDNKEMLKEKEITLEKFKEYIKTSVDSCKLILRSKSSNSAFEIKGVKFKETEPEEKEIVKKEKKKKEPKEKMEIEFVEKKKREKKKGEHGVDESLDNQIVQDYKEEEHDIMTIAEKYDIRPWQVVSLLVKYKVIPLRTSAKGYDIYKETDEYKSKIKEKKPDDGCSYI